MTKVAYYEKRLEELGGDLGALIREDMDEDGLPPWAWFEHLLTAAIHIYVKGNTVWILKQGQRGEVPIDGEAGKVLAKGLRRGKVPPRGHRKNGPTVYLGPKGE